MELLTDNIRNRLLQNGEAQSHVKGTGCEFDFMPVVKLFTPDAQCTWLLTELDPRDPDIAFGLADLWRRLRRIRGAGANRSSMFSPVMSTVPMPSPAPRAGAPTVGRNGRSDGTVIYFLCLMAQRTSSAPARSCMLSATRPSRFAS
jgi:hypothetical protein